ncbi:hypothetical protein [Streptomyces sp. NBC_00083]|uniref:hypothetical protein n=1 Tax=Streptomyces sp. NBC_00083 TaxID=2975647 RepID=UPI0022522510|nr:hypothetical protein [Streptomyces sp. NBC_00083]MCX5387285.1 hypothetical protein [Streptomyces sp. NBC_00083]
MAEIEVPGPEPEWEAAPSYQGEKRNPAFQQSMWTYAAGSFHLAGMVKPPLDALAGQLRLGVERGWEDLGDVDVAMFRISRFDFALSTFVGAVDPATFVWVSRSVNDVDMALGALFDALGLDRESLDFCSAVELGFEGFGGSPP